MNKNRELTPRERLVFALDVSTIEEARRWVRLLKKSVGMFKVGKELFTAFGPDAVRAVQEEGGKVFLDLKFHDIPNTTAMAAMNAVRLGVGIVNLHATGGLRMMERVVTVVREGCATEGRERPLLLAVTLLTSLAEGDLKEVGITGPVGERVVALASLARRAGMDGVVASPHEVHPIRERLGDGFVILTPGIRPSGSGADDQKRAMTPAEAIGMGSDYIVVGRPIRLSEEPVRAAEAILAEMEGVV
ncbi:MAG: orotidine-5'-phosphate decarboxylase [Deltaproteobacteria bacterium]|nr:orotidine-5'-phosphate decarboxylase [Deltaproteobacteria bacterium]